MKLFGNKDIFAIEYQISNCDTGRFEIWVEGYPVCCRIKDGTVETYEWTLTPCSCVPIANSRLTN